MGIYFRAGFLVGARNETKWIKYRIVYCDAYDFEILMKELLPTDLNPTNIWLELKEYWTDCVYTHTICNILICKPLLRSLFEFHFTNWNVWRLRTVLVNANFNYANTFDTMQQRSSSVSSSTQKKISFIWELSVLGSHFYATASISPASFHLHTDEWFENRIFDFGF